LDANSVYQLIRIVRSMRNWNGIKAALTDQGI